MLIKRKEREDLLACLVVSDGLMSLVWCFEGRRAKLLVSKGLLSWDFLQQVVEIEVCWTKPNDR